MTDVLGVEAYAGRPVVPALQTASCCTPMSG
jgi:hypothetical protein